MVKLRGVRTEVQMVCEPVSLEYSPSLRVPCILQVPDFKKSFKFTSLVMSDRVCDENFVSSRISLLNGQTDTSVPGIWCGVYVLHGFVVFCLV